LPFRLSGTLRQNDAKPLDPAKSYEEQKDPAWWSGRMTQAREQVRRNARSANEPGATPANFKRIPLPRRIIGGRCADA